MPLAVVSCSCKSGTEMNFECQGSGVLEFWGFGVLGFVGLWGLGFLGFWGLGVLGFWGFGVLGFSVFWALGSFRLWSSTTASSENLHGFLALSPFHSIVVSCGLKSEGWVISF
jgi:hypothetical protein